MLIYGEAIINKDQMLGIMGNALSGTCMESVDSIINNAEYAKGCKHFNITEYEFTRYLDDECIFECDKCGWWTYPGEGDGMTCDACLDD